MPSPSEVLMSPFRATFSDWLWANGGITALGLSMLFLENVPTNLGSEWGFDGTEFSEAMHALGTAYAVAGPIIFTLAIVVHGWRDTLHHHDTHNSHDDH